MVRSTPELGQIIALNAKLYAMAPPRPARTRTTSSDDWLDAPRSGSPAEALEIRQTKAAAERDLNLRVYHDAIAESVGIRWPRGRSPYAASMADKHTTRRRSSNRLTSPPDCATIAIGNYAEYQLPPTIGHDRVSRSPDRLMRVSKTRLIRKRQQGKSNEIHSIHDNWRGRRACRRRAMRSGNGRNTGKHVDHRWTT